MYQQLLELVPFVNIAVLISVASMAWKWSKKFTIIELKLDLAVENTEKCDKTMDKLGQRVALMEGQLVIMNRNERSR